MNLADIFQCREEFMILQTTRRTQTAMMRLAAGQASSDRMSVHPDSDQVVLLLEGRLIAEVGGEQRLLTPGNSLVIPAGTQHRLTNTGPKPVFAFTTYSPPAYPAER